MSNENENIPVIEEKDGSVIATLPDSVKIDEDDDDDDANEQADGGVVSDDGGNNEPDSYRLARRERRRAKKDLIRKTQAEKDERLQMLQRQNQELMDRLAVVEQRTHANDLAQIDKAVQDTELRIKYAKMKMNEAMSVQDGDALAQANEMLLDEHKKLEALRNFRQRAGEQPKRQNLPNPAVQRKLASWMERNAWFNPELKDMDSQIAKKIDDQLSNEGFDPAGSEYWTEMDNRLRKYLPHRYNDGYEDDSPRRRPRSPVTSSGRENAASAGGHQDFLLSPEQVKAMKDAGFWDDPKKRSNMIMRYALQQKQSRRS